MNLEQRPGNWIILLSFGFSLLLSIMPLPSWATLWRPDWISMILIYWAISIPQRIGIAAGWGIGILQDVLSDSLLGQHALSLSLIAYFAIRFHRRINLLPIWQQTLAVALLIAFGQLLNAWIQGLIGHPQPGATIFYPAISGLFFWPWLYLVLKDICQTYSTL